MFYPKMILFYDTIYKKQSIIILLNIGEFYMNNNIKNNKSINIDEIIFRDLEEIDCSPDTLYTAYIDEINDLDDMLGINTNDNHDECFQVNHYISLKKGFALKDTIEISALVTVFDKEMLFSNYPKELADTVFNLHKKLEITGDGILMHFSDNELAAIDNKFKDFIEKEIEEEKEL